MKANFLLFLFFLFPTFLFAQEEDSGTYLFDQFEDGFAAYKNGAKISSRFNYDVLTEKILFKDGDVTMELAATDDIVYVRITDRTFVHVKGTIYYERVQAGDDNFFIYWKYKIVSKGKEAGYGMTSQTSSITSVTMLETQGSGIQKLKSSEKFEVLNQSTYYLFINGKYRDFTSAKTFAKLFKKNEQDILAYIEKEKIDFREINDVEKLVSYSAQFEK